VIKDKNKIKYGLKVKLQDRFFQNLFKEYDTIRVDDKEQYFVCTKMEKGKQTYNLIPYTYDWIVRSTPEGNKIEPTIKIPFHMNLKLEDYFCIPNSPYMEAKVNGKWGILEVYHQKNRSSYHSTVSFDDYAVAISFKFAGQKDIEYVGNSTFIVTKGKEKRVVRLFKKDYCHTFHSESVWSSSYFNIESLLDGFVMTDERGKKKLGSFNCTDGEHVFETSEKEYDQIEEFHGKIRGIKKNADGTFKFDILKENSKMLTEDVLEYKNIDGYHACINSNGKTIIFDSAWNMKLLETKDVQSIHCIIPETLFDVTHTNGTHSVLPRYGVSIEISNMLSTCVGTYDKVRNFQLSNKNPFTSILVTQKMTDGMLDTQEYLIKKDSTSRDTRIVKLFDGKIVDYTMTPNGSHTIITVFDPNQFKNVSGVIENTRGYIEIPFDFDSITCQNLGEDIQFICTIGGEKSYFDQEGFHLPSFSNRPGIEKKIGSF